MKNFLLVFLFLIQLNLQAQKTSVAAHRGKAFLVPENTIRGMKKLLPTGIRYIEIDVRTSKDGKLVIMHDGSLKRTTNSRAKVSDLTLAELKEVKVTGWLNIRFRKNSISTLEEVCGLIKSWNDQHPESAVNLYVDCKEADPALLLSTLSKFGLEGDAVFYGKDSYLLELRKLNSLVKIMPALKKPEDLKIKAESLRPYAFDVSYAVLTTELVAAIHSKDILVFSDLLFFDDRKSAYQKAQRIGVDVIQTDRAKKVLRVVSKW